MWSPAHGHHKGETRVPRGPESEGYARHCTGPPNFTPNVQLQAHAGLNTIGDLYLGHYCRLCCTRPVSPCSGYWDRNRYPDPLPSPQPCTEARRCLSPDCEFCTPRGYPQAAEIWLRRITTNSALVLHGPTRLGLRSPEHATCDRCGLGPPALLTAQQTIVTVATTGQPSGPLATLRHLFLVCSARRQEREVALTQPGPVRPYSLEACKKPEGGPSIHSWCT